MKTPFHFHSEDGATLSLALLLKREGHPVTLKTHSPESKQVGKGLVDIAKEPPRGSVVIFDTVGKGDLGALYRKQGHLVIGGNDFDKPLELNRPRGAKIMRDVGITTPPTFPFKDVPTAIKFLEKAKGGWFVKVSGIHADCQSTFNAPDPESMIRYLTWLKDSGPVDPFELQQKVEGTEISCNGWFNGREFIPPFDLTIEEKKFLTGDLGPRTGCESCMVWHEWDESLPEKTVLLMEELLAENKYVGPIDLNSLVDSQGTPQGLEWSARLGFDSTQAWMRLFDGDLGEQLEAFAAGELRAWEPRSVGEFSGTLRVSVPPYPAFDEKLVKPLMGLPLDKRVLGEWFDPADVMEGPACAGASGWIGTVTARDKSIKGLKSTLLALAGELEIPNKQYRTDPLSRAEKDMKELKRLKYVSHQVPVS